MSVIPSFRVHGQKNERERINALFNALHEALSNFVPEDAGSSFTNIASHVDAQHHDFAIACEERDEGGEER